jgi:hypothetical protein
LQPEDCQDDEAGAARVPQSYQSEEVCTTRVSACETKARISQSGNGNTSNWISPSKQKLQGTEMTIELSWKATLSAAYTFFKIKM